MVTAVNEETSDEKSGEEMLMRVVMLMREVRRRRRFDLAHQEAIVRPSLVLTIMMIRSVGIRS